MRLNQFIALATGISRRSADREIKDGKVRVNNQNAILGQLVNATDNVVIGGALLVLPSSTLTIMLNKPVGYVCSRDGQGSKTIYDLLPDQYHNLKPVGRLDKDSSGLLLLTNDGQLAHKLTHPSFSKQKVYETALNKPLSAVDKSKIESGVNLEDGLSKIALQKLSHITASHEYLSTIYEGRNRQIRRTFESLGYKVTKLHRIQFGKYNLNSLASGEFAEIKI